MNRGELIGGTFEFHADLPQDVFDQILGNTPEEMRRMLTPGNTFELYDREGHKVVYVALPEEHGRLIDADKLITLTVYNEKNEPSIQFVPKEFIDEAETIVPSTKQRGESK